MSRTDHHPVGSTAKNVYRDRLEHRTNHYLCRRNVLPKRVAIAEQMYEVEPVEPTPDIDDGLTWDWDMFLTEEHEFISEAEAEELAWDQFYEDMTAHDYEEDAYDRRYEEDDDERPWMESMSLNRAYRELGDSFTVSNPAHIPSPQRVKCESMRVYEIAKAVGLESSVVIDVLRTRFQEYVATASSAVVMPVAKAVMEFLGVNIAVDIEPAIKAKPLPTRHPMLSYPRPRPGNNPFVTR